MKSALIALCLGLLSTTALAGDRSSCTAQCGGKPGGEAANSPSVVACFRKCMGTPGGSDNVKTKQGKSH